MKKLAEISRLTLEAFTSEDSAAVKRATIEDINKVGDLGLSIANENADLKKRIITRELRDNPMYIGTLAETIINEEPEMADQIVKANIVRYAEKRNGVLTTQQNYFPEPTFGAGIGQFPDTETIHITPEGPVGNIPTTTVEKHRDLNKRFGYVFMTYEEDVK